MLFTHRVLERRVTQTTIQKLDKPSNAMKSNDSFNAAMPPTPTIAWDMNIPRPIGPNVHDFGMDRFRVAHGYSQVPLEDFEEHLQHLVTARAALDAALDKRVREPHLPHSAAIDELIAHMPFQNKVALVGWNLGPATTHEELGANQRALHNCSAVMAAADQTVERFLRAPSCTDPVEVHVVALILDQALSALEAAYA
jgi:hypothetical protein